MKPNSRAAVCGIEQLESRIAPAGVTVVGKTATWTDWDGDHITMKWTGSNAPDFTHNHAPAGAVADGIVLDEIILKNDNDAITVTVKAAPGGDGRVDLGYLDATGRPLKSFLAPKASVLEFDCGDAVHAIGTLRIAGYGTVDPAAFTTPGGDSTGRMDGGAGTVVISGDVDYGELYLGHNSTTPIGSVTIGGSIHGNVARAASSSVLAGFVTTVSPGGAFKVGHDIVGGSTDDSGLLSINANWKSVTVGGDIVGGTGVRSGRLILSGDDHATAVVTVGGSVIGGSGEATGRLFVSGAARSITVGGDLHGGSSDLSGVLDARGAIGSIVVKGSVLGGTVKSPLNDQPTGAIETDSASSVHSITIGRNLVAGTVTGGALTYNGAVLIEGNLGSLNIGGSIEGSNGFRAFVLVDGTTPVRAGNFNALGKLSVKGKVDYAVIASGQDYATSYGASPGGGDLGAAENPDASIGAVTIGGNYWHTSLMAGVNDGEALGVGHTNLDTQSVGDAARIAVLGPVVIKGAVLDDYDSTGVSGFEAEQIAKITVGGIKLFTHGDPKKYFDFSQFVFAQEIAAM